MVVIILDYFTVVFELRNYAYYTCYLLFVYYTKQLLIFSFFHSHQCL
jgi:hypothetical protein